MLALLFWYIMFANPNLDILAVFILPHPVSTQHPPHFHPASPLCLETFHPASTHYSTHIKLGHSSSSKAVVPQQTYSNRLLSVSEWSILWLHNIAHRHTESTALFRVFEFWNCVLCHLNFVSCIFWMKFCKSVKCVPCGNFRVMAGSPLALSAALSAVAHDC